MRQAFCILKGQDGKQMCIPAPRFKYPHIVWGTEIAPQDLQVHLSAIGTATHWLFYFVIMEITLIAFVTITWRYYIVYAVIGVFAVMPWHISFSQKGEVVPLKI